MHPLQTYLNWMKEDYPRGQYGLEMTALAERIGCKRLQLYRAVDGHPLPPSAAMLLEIETDGQVPAWTTCPTAMTTLDTANKLVMWRYHRTRACAPPSLL